MNRGKWFSYGVGVLVGGLVLYFSWPKMLPTPPAKNPTNAGWLQDGATVQRVKAALNEKGITATAPLQKNPNVVFSSLSIDPTTGLTRVPHAAVEKGVVRKLTIKELGNFGFDPLKDTEIPTDVKALDGSKVKLQGYIWPLGQADVLSDFILVPSLTSCCYGQPPGVQHIVTVKLPPQKGVPFVPDLVEVTGTLKIRIVREEDYTSNIFDMTAESVKIAQP